MRAIIDGFTLLDGSVLLFMLLGVVVSQVIAVIPGLGGMFALVLLIPFAIVLDTPNAIAMLLAAAVTSGTGNSVTGILFGIPGSPTGVATVFDGYPLAKQGQAARALGAGLGVSAVGGVIGAVVLAAMIPLLKPIILTVGPAEFFLLVIIALVLLSKIGIGETRKALIAAGLGFVVASVGIETSTGSDRFTYGSIMLYDGIDLLAFLIGFYAIAEMLSMMRKSGPIAEGADPSTSVGSMRGVLHGLRDIWTYRRIVLQSSAIGTAVGTVPGLGGDAAAFLSYGAAMRISKEPEKFGHGSIEGVLAADASQNSKEGGALLPTLLLGIPGSAGMAVLLAAFITIGVSPGARLVNQTPEIVWFMIWILVIASIVASMITLVFVAPMAKLTFLKSSTIVPPVLVLSFFGAYASLGRAFEIWVAIGAGILGYIMVELGFPRPTFVIALVLGPILEHNLGLAMQLYGWGMLQRPAVIAMLFLAVSVLGWSPAKRLFVRSGARQEVKVRG